MLLLTACRPPPCWLLVRTMSPEWPPTCGPTHEQWPYQTPPQIDFWMVTEPRFPPFWTKHESSVKGIKTRRVWIEDSLRLTLSSSPIKTQPQWPPLSTKTYRKLAFDPLSSSRQNKATWASLELPHPPPKPENHRSITYAISSFGAEAPLSWAFFEARLISASHLVRISTVAAIFLATKHQELFIIAHRGEHWRTLPTTPLRACAQRRCWPGAVLNRPWFSLWFGLEAKNTPSPVLGGRSCTRRSTLVLDFIEI
jgi:hypothetical protein